MKHPTEFWQNLTIFLYNCQQPTNENDVMPYSSLEKIGYSSTIDFEVVLIYGWPYIIDAKKKRVQSTARWKLKGLSYKVGLEAHVSVGIF